MSNYYVRQGGSDGAAGTSAGAAWATLGKALGASGIASGDTLYIGAGTYREAVTIAMTSATAETKVIGDTDGSHTGDAGMVRVTSVLEDRQVNQAVSIALNGKSWLTFENLYIDATQGSVSALVGNSVHITFRNCVIATWGTAVPLQVVLSATANWLIEGCTIFGFKGQIVQFTLATNGSADYDADVVINNCVLIGQGNTVVAVTASGALSFKGGGVKVRNCTILGSGGVVTSSTGVSTSIPVTLYNCLFLCTGTAQSALTTGQVVEDFNVIYAGNARSNVNAGLSSVVNGNGPVIPLLELGQSEMAGLARRPFYSLGAGSPLLGFGNLSGSPSTDMLGRPRPSGTISFKASGTATSGAAGTLTDSGATWRTNAFIGLTVRITGGTGSGQTKQIVSNTGTALTVSGNWATTPDNTSTYEIYDGCPTTTGKATAGSANTLTDSNATWGTLLNRWTGFTVEITAGTGSGQSKRILSHTGTVLTTSTNWSTNPDSTSVYAIYVATGLTTAQPSVGAYERHDTATRETSVVDAGSNAVSSYGPWVHDFQIPVDATSTTIGVKSQFDSKYGAGTKPQMKVLNGTECGVADASSTSTQTAGNWYSHSLTFTPTSQGVVTVRLIAYGAIDSKTAFDTFTKS